MSNVKDVTKAIAYRKEARKLVDMSYETSYWHFYGLIVAGHFERARQVLAQMKKYNGDYYLGLATYRRFELEIITPITQYITETIAERSGSPYK